MTESLHASAGRMRADARVRLSFLAFIFSLTLAHATGAVAHALLSRSQDERTEVTMRSYAPPASGRLTIEATDEGGRVRLTALSLPDPRTVSPRARTYVVWAISEGRIVRLGELRRDRSGNGGLAFERPEGFARYSVIVTAEASAEADRPGSPVLATRADEAATLYPPSPASTPAAATRGRTASRTTPAAKTSSRRARPARRGDFYSEVDDALDARGGGRLIELESEPLAPGASGEARAALDSGRAYIRADFEGVPLPSAVGASVYVLWAVLPDARIVYLGSLPVGDDLNEAEIYVRVAGFDTDDFTLFVTAERARPASSPSGRRVLTSQGAHFVVK